ncbi:MAG: class I SAM-dependent rRNA methyltransferase [Firmicutes bacterium]|nr:class I SAM-dependent rRNA methyltransferase [Bacillota bacterium]
MDLEKPAELRLKRGREERLRAGHLWVYEGEVAGLPEGVAPGELVDVFDARGRFLGRGYYNPASQIVARILTRKKETVDAAFFRRRLEVALAHRQRACPDLAAVRLVYGEGDLLPGLVVDRYGEYLVVQFLTMGMEVRRETILSLLVELLRPAGIRERSTGTGRKNEGLSPREETVYGTVPEEVIVEENGLRYLVDLHHGQKTGHFLDQRENRAAAAALARGRRVLDCFCYTGAFGLAAALAGADEVLGVDFDEAALEVARRNAVLNGLADRCEFVAANAFDFLRAAVEEGRQYDLVILDPPAFTKSKFRVEEALRGYKEINLRALRLLFPGGILVTCSCSHHVSYPLFQEVVQAAAADAGRRLRLLARRGHPADHPVLLGVPETEYLKCLILEVLV